MLDLILKSLGHIIRSWPGNQHLHATDLSIHVQELCSRRFFSLLPYCI